MVPEAAGSNPVSHPFCFLLRLQALTDTRRLAERIFQNRVIGNFPENSELERSTHAETKPNQLRHTRATEIRAEFGLDSAASVLGHSQITTTQVYAEQDKARAIEVAKKTG